MPVGSFGVSAAAPGLKAKVIGVSVSEDLMAASVTQPTAVSLQAGLYDFGSFIDGEVARDDDAWTYSVRASALVDDPLGATAYKRSLDQGKMSPEEYPEIVLGRCALARPEMMEKAVLAASGAAARWAMVPFEQRLTFADRFRRRVKEHAGQLIDLLVGEGHPLRLARSEISNVLAFFGPETTRWCAEQMQTNVESGQRRLMLRRRPDGVVCVQPPQNTPLISVAAALQATIAGNCLVMRLSRQAPLTAMYLVQRVAAPALAEAGAPAGALSVLCAEPAATMKTWLASPLVDDIFYFGDSTRGMRLQSDCLRRGKKPVLELAGNDIVVVWKDTELPLVIEALSESFYAAGQICCAPNVVIAHPEVADDLLDRLQASARALRPGPPDDPEVVLTPTPSGPGYDAALADARAQGAQVLCGGRHLDVHGEERDTGIFLEPAVVRADGLRRASRLRSVRQETFFPLLTVVVPDANEDEPLLDRVLEFANASSYGLRCSLWARDAHVTEQFLGGISSFGQLRVNDSHLAPTPYLPNHGGTGLSGGAFGEANYPMLRTSHLQTVSVAEAVSPREALSEVFDREVGLSGVALGPRPVARATGAHPAGWPPPDLPGGLPAPFTPRFQQDPHPTLRWLRENRPVSRIVAPDGAGWLLTRYDDVRQAHRDKRISCDSKRTPAGILWGGEWPDELRKRLFTHLLDTDDPRHGELRRLMSPLFTASRQGQWQTKISEIVNARIDRMAPRGRGDLMSEVAYPLGAHVLFSVLGAPVPDLPVLRALTWRLVDWNTTVPYFRALTYQADAMMADVLADKRRRPGHDLLSLLVRACDEEGLITADELEGMFLLMLVAGQDPSINSVGNSMHTLLTHPEQADLLRADPALLTTGTDELLRFNSPLTFTSWRGTLEPVEFSGVTVPADESLIVSLGSANRDAAHFDQPDALNLSRTPNHHLAYGHGIHYCLGAQIGRLTAETAISTLLRRLPDLRLAGPVRWRPGQFERGLEALPVTWDPCKVQPS
ncbi:aldehyde dehydrogenase family protein [Streptomyces iconiensis]|uniref:Aldehyde dehydrogenase family protein n=1 Tax=Streptomyces iconiensis TaxID=1384038 RepID=A0ABT6ZN49_9ACTN|nr:aldehyde dehydrogenase family protein [Streptomyces iconiensis]MDJ1130480.1 aldehyde dehydrogenase family protein [Streptomyces iconiensis]